MTRCHPCKWLCHVIGSMTSDCPGHPEMQGQRQRYRSSLCLLLSIGEVEAILMLPLVSTNALCCEQSTGSATRQRLAGVGLHPVE